MRQSARALGITVTISMLILFAFLATAVYSVFQTALLEQGIKFGEIQPHFSNNMLILSVPVSVNNTGYYDMTDFNITTTLGAPNGSILTRSSTVIADIKKGAAQQRLHNLSLSLADLLSNRYLLFNDSELKIDVSMGFRYAYAIGLQLAIKNISMPWGAPLYGLTLRGVQISSFNMTHLTLDVFLEAENHSFFDIAGNLNLKVYNETGGYIGSGRKTVNIPSNTRLSNPTTIAITIENPLNYSGRGYVEINFELTPYHYILDLGMISYG